MPVAMDLERIGRNAQAMGIGEISSPETMQLQDSQLYSLPSKGLKHKWVASLSSPIIISFHVMKIHIFIHFIQVK